MKKYKGGRMNFKKKDILSYALMLIFVINYYFALERADKISYVWILGFLVAMIFHIYLNWYLYKKKEEKFLYYDMGFILLILSIPRISAPYGISRLLAALIGVGLIRFIRKKKEGRNK